MKVTKAQYDDDCSPYVAWLLHENISNRLYGDIGSIMLIPDREKCCMTLGWQRRPDSKCAVVMLRACIDSSSRFLVQLDKDIPQGLALLSVHLHPGQG